MMLPVSPDDEDRQVRLPVGLPPDLYEWLRGEAFRKRRKMAAIVRDAVAEYRSRVDPQMGLPLTVTATRRKQATGK